MRRSTSFILLLTFCLLFSACTPAKPIYILLPEPDYWPTQGWHSSTPEAQGMDSALLAQTVEEINANQTNLHSLLVVRNGYLVTEAYFHPYTPDTKIHIQSITKSVIGTLVGAAIQAGYIDSVEQELLDFYPGRMVANPSRQKESIQLKHLLSMSSGLDCLEFSGSGPRMEQANGWVQFMLDLPVVSAPGKRFGYCNGSAHLLSAIIEKATAQDTRLFANQLLFEPLGIPAVEPADWMEDPQRFNTGGYGLYLTPRDLAKLAFLYLHGGKWEDRQILPPSWTSESTTQYVQKEDGSGYGYMWTVYPDEKRYAALGLGGQQIHVYPSHNLIVVVTAALESYAEAPEIEHMLNDYILPAVKSNLPLPEDSQAYTRLQAAVQTAAHPLQEVPPLPEIAGEISGVAYWFGENPVGWQKLALVFEPGSVQAKLFLDDYPPLAIGLDNLYRQSTLESLGDLHLRGRWIGQNTFVVDYPYALSGPLNLAELGASEFSFTFSESSVEVAARQLIFGGEPVVFQGTR